MNRSYPLARAPHVRRPLQTAVALLVVLAQVTACQPDSEQPGPGPGPVDPPDQSTNNPSPTAPTPVQTSPFSLTASDRDPDGNHRPPPGSEAFLGELTTDSARGGTDFSYDAYIVTARATGTMTIQSDVIESNVYRYGYGYPLTLTTIEDGGSFTLYRGRYVQDALETGTAIIEYPVEKGRQYILVYKTFTNFTPLTYRLTLPSTLTVEGRIYKLPEPVPVPPISSGPITLENPRPDALNRFVSWFGERANEG